MTIVKTQIQSGGKITTTSTYNTKTGEKTKTSSSSSKGSSGEMDKQLTTGEYDPITGTYKQTGVIPTEQVKPSSGGSGGKNTTSIETSITPDYGGGSIRTTTTTDKSGFVTQKQEQLSPRSMGSSVLGSQTTQSFTPTEGNASASLLGQTPVMEKRRLQSINDTNFNTVSISTNKYSSASDLLQSYRGKTQAQIDMAKKIQYAVENLGIESLSKTAQAAQERVQRGDKGAIFTAIGAGVTAAVLQAGKTAGVTIADALNPVNTVKLIQGFNTGEITASSIFGGVSERAGVLGMAAQSGDVKSAGTITGAIFGATYAPTLTSVLAKGVKGVGTAVTEISYIGKPKLPARKYIDESVFEGTTFPTAKSTKETELEFLNSKTAITFSPTGFKPTKIGESSKSKLGLEDPGVFVTPLGRGNPYFTRAFQSEKSTYTLNPLQGAASDVETILNAFKKPTVTQFEIQGVARLPKNVLDVPGFAAVRKYQNEVLAGTGKVQITKRSMIGQGEQPRQSYFNPVSGKIQREMGTGEKEGVLPSGSVISKTKDIGYLEYQGKKIRVQEGILDVTKKTSNSFDDITNLKGSSRIDLKPTSSSYKPQVRYTSSSIPKGSLFSSSLGSTSKGGGSLYSSFKVGSSSGGNSFKAGSSNSLFKGASSNISKGLSVSGISGGLSSGGGSFNVNSDTFRKPFKIEGKKSEVEETNAREKGRVFRKPFKIEGKKSEVEETNAAYNVYAREKGRVFKLNKSPMPQNKAFNTGEYYINNTTARSFELRLTGKQATVPDENLKRNAEQYRERKTKTALRVVEKEKYSINTTGEKQGLSIARLLKSNGGLRL